MATLSAADKASIAAEIRVVATWVDGPRRRRVLALADRIEGVEDEAPEAAVVSEPPPQKSRRGAKKVASVGEQEEASVTAEA